MQTLRHQIELLLKKNSILNEELKQSKMKQKTELSSQLKESENRHDERVKLLENEVTEKVNEHAKTAAAAIALAARIESESKTSKDTNLELKKKIKSLQSKIGIIQETNHSGKHKRRSAIAQIKLHGLEQDSKKIAIRRGVVDLNPNCSDEDREELRYHNPLWTRAIVDDSTRCFPLPIMDSVLQLSGKGFSVEHRYTP